MKGDEQICWSCDKACGLGCCWFKENKPVPNWVATETKIKVTAENGKKRYYVSSYKIEKCPLYKCQNPVEELSSVVISKVVGVSPSVVRTWILKGKLKPHLDKNKAQLKKLEYYYVK